MTGPSAHYSRCSVRRQYMLRRASAVTYPRHVREIMYQWRFQGTALHPFSPCLSLKSYGTNSSSTFPPRSYISSWIPRVSSMRLDFASVHAAQKATKDVTATQCFLAPLPCSSICETTKQTAIQIRSESAGNRCCYMCASADNTPIRGGAASAVEVTHGSVSEAVAVLRASGLLSPRSTAALSVSAFPSKTSYLAGAASLLAVDFTFPAFSGTVRVDPPSATSFHIVAAFRFPAAENNVSSVVASSMPVQGRQARLLLGSRGLSPVAGHQSGCRRVSTLRQTIKSSPDIDRREQLHGEENQWKCEALPREDHRGLQQQQQQRHGRHRQQQPQPHGQQEAHAERQQPQWELQDHWWDEQRGVQNTVNAPSTGQLKPRCKCQQQWQQHEHHQKNRGQQQNSQGWQPGAHELKRQVQDEYQFLWRSYRIEVERNTACNRATRLSVCSTHLRVHCSLEQALSSRLLAFRSSSIHLLPVAGFRCFSTSSELLARELQRRLEDEKAGRTTTAGLYDRQRQGIVLAIADDVLLVRGLAAAPVGTLVAFSQHAGDPSRMAPTTAVGDERQSEAAAREGATAAGKGTRVAEVGDNKRKADAEDKPALVLGVVLQLLQQALNIVGLLGASSSFSSAGDYLPFRNPCVGDLCTCISAYEDQPRHLQQHSPEQDEESQRQSVHDEGGQERRVPQGDAQQPRRPYKLINACFPACGGLAIASPLALLYCSTPVPAKSDKELDACEQPVAFFNAFDLSESSLPSQPCHQTSIQLPWGLLTGSAVVDALAPLQVGEASAFLGPPGTGKTQALVPVVALHAAAAAAAADAASTAGAPSAPTDRLSSAASTAADAPPVTRFQKRTALSVVALALGSSPSVLRRWLHAVSEEIVVWSSAAANGGETGRLTASSAAEKSEVAAKTESSSLTNWWFRGSSSRISSGDGTPISAATSAASAASTAPAHTAANSPLASLNSVVLLHVPAPQAAASEAAAARTAEGTDLRGYRIHPTSCLMYLAPVLALRLALEAQAEAAAFQRTPCPVLLVIDGLAMHAAAVEQLQQNIRRLLCSYPAGVHLPAGVAGLTAAATTARLPPGAASAYGAAAAAAVALPFSATSLYGMLASKASRSAGGGVPLSVLLVLDTPSDPAVLIARNLQPTSNSFSVQQQRIEKTLAETVKGEDSVGVVLSQKRERQAQEALLASVHRTILFALAAQQQGQHQDVACAAQKAVQREQLQRQPRLKAGVDPGWRKKNLLVDRIYPMIDIDSMVATSTAALSADACMALSQSCFAGKDSGTEEADGVSLETLRGALKALCMRQLRAERERQHTVTSSTLTAGAHTLASTLQGRQKGIKEARKRGQPLFEPPALLAAAAAAFAWQRRVLHNESQRQELMQQFRLFVDVWEREDVDSLSIASAVCLACPTGRIFSPTEQLVLLRAAATLFFTPARAPESTGEKGGRCATEACGATPMLRGVGGPRIGFGEKGLLSFAQICAFQEDMLQLFRKKEPRLWEAVQQHLQRAGEWPVELHCGMLEKSKAGPTHETGITYSSPNKVGKNPDTSNMQISAEEEEEVEQMAQHVMCLLNRIDGALLAMRNYFDITAPYFPDD